MKTLIRIARVSGLALMLTAGATNAQTAANGPYYATPSWDQTLPAANRFVVLANFASQAVLDRETGLVWERALSTTTRTSYFGAFDSCLTLPHAGRLGWRLPSFSELSSLFDPSISSGSTLAAGNPFTVPTLGYFWTTTSSSYPTDNSRYAGGTLQLIGVTTFSGGPQPKAGTAYAWCVRGPGDAGTFNYQ